MDSGESMDASRMDGYPLPLHTSHQITSMLVGRINLLLDWLSRHFQEKLGLTLCTPGPAEQ